MHLSGYGWKKKGMHNVGMIKVLEDAHLDTRTPHSP
jgi:hypothetical protein